jgi:hypothetical protein
MPDGSTGADILGIGWITADFHCVGTVEDRRERFIRWVKGLEMKGAASLRNQKGKLSGPEAVVLSLFKSLKTQNSVTGLVTGEAVNLREGC